MEEVLKLDIYVIKTPNSLPQNKFPFQFSSCFYILRETPKDEKKFGDFCFGRIGAETKLIKLEVHNHYYFSDYKKEIRIVIDLPYIFICLKNSIFT